MAIGHKIFEALQGSAAGVGGGISLINEIRRPRVLLLGAPLGKEGNE